MMHVASSMRSPAVWIHTREGMIHPPMKGERVLRLDKVTVTRLWQAILRTELRRSDARSLASLVAEELAFESEIRFPPEEEAGPATFRPVVARLRGMECPGDPGGCIVALVMEALAHLEGYEGLQVVGCYWRPNGTCGVALGPAGASAEDETGRDDRP